MIGVYRIRLFLAFGTITLEDRFGMGIAPEKEFGITAIRANPGSLAILADSVASRVFDDGFIG